MFNCPCDLQLNVVLGLQELPVSLRPGSFLPGDFALSAQQH